MRLAIRAYSSCAAPIRGVRSLQSSCRSGVTKARGRRGLRICKLSLTEHIFTMARTASVGAFRYCVDCRAFDVTACERARSFTGLRLRSDVVPEYDKYRLSSRVEINGYPKIIFPNATFQMRSCISFVCQGICIASVSEVSRLRMSARTVARFIVLWNLIVRFNRITEVAVCRFDSVRGPLRSRRRRADIPRAGLVRGSRRRRSGLSQIRRAEKFL